jgi:toxin ParE1/3/4
MKKGLTLRKDAEKDLQAAFFYYQSCRQGLGHEFLLCVEMALEEICRNLIHYRQVYRDIHRVTLHRFPYAVYFICRDEKIIVLAVMHIRRDPDRWQARS